MQERGHHKRADEQEYMEDHGEVSEEAFLAVLAEAAGVVERTGLPHAFMGGVASAALGRPRWTHDVDLMVRKEDADAILKAFAEAGFDTERRDPAWLYKAVKDRVLVDMIFQSAGGIVLDQEMLDHVRRVEFKGLRLNVLSPEDQVVIKAVVHKEFRSRHWFDALALLATGQLDWDYLLQRARFGPRRLLSLLLYAQSNDVLVPDWVVMELYRRVFEGGAPRREGRPAFHRGREPDEYRVARVQEALASDPRTAELELDVAIHGDIVVVQGVVATPQRREAVTSVIREVLPGMEVRNRATVSPPPAEPTVERFP